MTTHQGPMRFDGPPETLGRQKTPKSVQTTPDSGKRKGGFDGERTRTEPRYEKTRETRSGMGNCSKVGSVMRAALKDYLYCVRDRYHTGRLNGLLVTIKSCDPVMDVPKTLKGGLDTAAGGAVLQLYAFQPGRRISANVRRPFTLDLAAGTLAIPQFTPAQDHVFPKGTKMVGLQLLLLRIDLDTLAYSMTVSPVAAFTPADTQPINLVLEAQVPEGEGHLFALLFSGFCDVERGVLRWGMRKENVLGFLGVGV